MHTGEEDHAQPGWTTSRRGQDSPWKSQSEWQRTGINGESTSMVWPTLGSRTAKEQNRTELLIEQTCKWKTQTVKDNRGTGMGISNITTAIIWQQQYTETVSCTAQTSTMYINQNNPSFEHCYNYSNTRIHGVKVINTLQLHSTDSKHQCCWAAKVGAWLLRSIGLVKTCHFHQNYDREHSGK